MMIWCEFSILTLIVAAQNLSLQGPLSFDHAMDGADGCDKVDVEHQVEGDGEGLDWPDSSLC